MAHLLRRFPMPIPANIKNLKAPIRDAVASQVSSITSTSPSTVTWSHTVSTAASTGALLVVMHEYCYNGWPGPTSMTYNGATMTQVGGNGAFYSFNGLGAFFAFYLQNPSSGANTVVLNSPAAGPSAASVYLAAASVSYSNVSSVTATFQTATGTSTTPTQAATAAPGTAVLQAFGNFSTTAAFGSYTAPENTLVNNTYASATNYPFVVGDESNLLNPTFANTLSSSVNWGGVGIVINGTATYQQH